MKCLIIEDEFPAQQVLLCYIEKTSFLECIGVYESVIEVTKNKLNSVDFIFLDMQLPEINGLSFLKALDIKPKVIVTTAYRGYAIEAFEVSVSDFLLKPFSYNRFLKALMRIEDSVLSTTINNNEFFVYADKTFHRINKNAVLYIKAEVDYVYVVATTKKILVQDTLSNWNNKLKDSGFIRVHRSYIVNLNKIDKVIGNLIYISDQKIPIGNTYKSSFFEFLKK
jgi:DNA-binding LytR/AlgR family response regulator